MSLNQPATGEREPLRWESATMDSEDIKGIFGDDFLGLVALNASEDVANTGRLILRRGKTVIGFLSYQRIDDLKEIGPLLYINLVYIKPSDRSSVVFRNIVKTIRDLAETKHLQHIAWKPVRINARKMSHKIRGLSNVDGELEIMPTKDLDIDSLINMQTKWRKRENKSRSTSPKHV